MNGPLEAVFLKWPDGQVIALFCGSEGYCSPGNVMSYMRIGQHSEASPALAADLPLATPAEYAPLHAELESIYETRVRAVVTLEDAC